MKHSDNLHELLIFSNTSFSKKEFCEKEGTENLNQSSAAKLEKACWSGLLFEMLPEILGNSNYRHENFIWEVMQAHQYVRVCLGPAPAALESKSCLDPYFFLPTYNQN
jgi:hypothetical protein